MPRFSLAVLMLLVTLPFASMHASAQSAPSAHEIADYTGLHAAAQQGNLLETNALLEAGADTEIRDTSGRTALHVASFASQEAVVRRLASANADLDALDAQAYDAVTIASVANDLPLLTLLIEQGASAGNVTSPYEGTALIAAAHLGHAKIVQRLVKAGAPLDHVNNLGWTALIEAVILGDGGPDHIATVAALLDGGASMEIADRRGITPLTHARERGYHEIVELLEIAH